MPFPHEAILGLGFFSALVDAFHHHSWPSATRDGEMHQLVLRKSLTLELPHVETIHFLPDTVREEMYLFQEVGNPELVFPSHQFLSLWQDEYA